MCQRHASVVAYIADPNLWSEVVWTCRDHRAEATSGVTQPARHADLLAWQTERDAALAAISALPKSEREYLYGIAARGPAGVELSREAPLFTAQLVRVYRVRAMLTGSGGS